MSRGAAGASGFYSTMDRVGRAAAAAASIITHHITSHDHHTPSRAHEHRREQGKGGGSMNKNTGSTETGGGGGGTATQPSLHEQKNTYPTVDRDHVTHKSPQKTYSRACAPSLPCACIHTYTDTCERDRTLHWGGRCKKKECEHAET